MTLKALLHGASPVEYLHGETDIFSIEDVFHRASAKTQRAPSITKITSSKLEIRNSKQIQMIKNHNVPNNLILDFEF